MQTVSGQQGLYTCECHKKLSSLMARAAEAAQLPHAPVQLPQYCPARLGCAVTYGRRAGRRAPQAHLPCAKQCANPKESTHAVAEELVQLVTYITSKGFHRKPLRK